MKKLLQAFGIAILFMFIQAGTIQYFNWQLGKVVNEIVDTATVYRFVSDSVEQIAEIRKEISPLLDGEIKELGTTLVYWRDLGTRSDTISEYLKAHDIDKELEEKINSSLAEAGGELQILHPEVSKAEAADLDIVIEHAFFLDESLRQLVEGMSILNVHLRDSLSEVIEVERRIHNRPLLFGGGVSLIAVVLLGFFAFNFSSRFAGPLHRIIYLVDRSANEVGQASGQLVSSSKGLAEDAGGQTVSLDKTSASLKEITDMTKQTFQNAKSVKESAECTRQAADSGVVNIQEMAETINRIKNAGEEMGEATREVRDSCNDVSKIVKTIDKIASQTNLLALNAAVEAARAGEAGQGFAVVADEVRSLAKSTTKAARETSEKIQDSLTKSEHSFQASKNVAECVVETRAKASNMESAFNGIVEKAHEVENMISQITDAAEEQSLGIDQVNHSVLQMDKVTRSNEATAKESATASSELSVQADCLREAVADLRSLVGNQTGDEVKSEKQKSTAQPLFKFSVPFRQKPKLNSSSPVNFFRRNSQAKKTAIVD